MNLQTDVAGTHWKVLGEQELGGIFPFFLLRNKERLPVAKHNHK